MGETLTYVTELAVGLGCFIGAVPMARAPRRRWLAFILAAAGAAAVLHATVRLLG